MSRLHSPDNRPVPARSRNADLVVVVLVHGTFAPKAPWSRSDSDFAEALALRLGPNTLVETFDWSGANSHEARLLAGQQLSERLRSIHAKHDRYRIFIIGHSHGGNVALYALREHEDQGLVSGVVCMATPFLSVRRRDVTRDLSTWRSGMLLCAFTLVGLIAMMLGSLPLILTVKFLRHAPDWVYLLVIVLPAMWIVTKVVNVVPMVLARFSAENVREWVSTRAEELVSKLVIPDIHVPVLTVATSGGAMGDEALFHLSLIRRLLSMSFVLWDKKVPAALFAFGLLFGIVARTPPFWGEKQRTVVVVITWCVYLATLGQIAWSSLASTALLRTLQFLFASNPLLHRLFFGALGGFDNWLIDALAEPSFMPVPSARHVMVEYKERTAVTKLRHSMIHEDPNVRNLISDWIVEVGRKQGEA